MATDRAALPDKSHNLSEVLVATTWECNLHCSYCFVHNKKLTVNQERMSPDLAVRVIDALDRGLAHIEKICIHLYGGEPLINIPAIEAMVRWASKKSKRFLFSVTTNGVINDSAVYNLLDKGHFQIILSIDGPKKVHDECRRTISGAPTHAHVLRFLKNIRTRTHCWVRGSAVVRPGWSLLEAVSYMNSLPLDAIKAQAVRVPPDSPYALSDREKTQYLYDLDELGKQVIADLETSRIPKDDRFSSRVLQLLARKNRNSFCGAGQTSFGIAPDGSVLPCILMDRHEARLGHVDDNPTVWLQKGVDWRKQQRNSSECRHCNAYSLCGGGCHAVISVCGENECEIIRKNCEVATKIYQHFQSNPERLLALAGIV